MEEFPEEFLAFLRENDIDVRVFQSPPTLRYVRLNSRSPPSLSDFAHELQSLNPHTSVSVSPVPWLPDFYSVPAAAKIASTSAYKHGEIYGMDASSAVPVALLGITPGDEVLDLCCAPGMKLLFAAEMLQGRGSVTGVDISAERLRTCSSLLRKYAFNARLFEADGKTFETLSDTGSLYSKVMVDAECTHEGSVKHLEKFGRQWGWDTFKSRVLDTHSDLQQLQRGLARNGAKLLRPGGRMTYSTCSFCKSQNEDIVSWLVAECPDLRVCDLSHTNYPAGKGPLGLRFDPVTSNTGGQFVCLLEKISV